jgi:hypothetical protein
MLVRTQKIFFEFDSVYPPKEPEALFVTSNFLETNFQYRSICTGNDNEVLIPSKSQWIFQLISCSFSICFRPKDATLMGPVQDLLPR